MANRFSNLGVQPTLYLRKPWETILKVGMIKDQYEQSAHDQIQAQIDARSNYLTAYVRDTETKMNLDKDLQDKLQQHAVGELSDPLTWNKVHQDLFEYSNNPYVAAATDRTRIYKEYAKKAQDKDFHPENVTTQSGTPWTQAMQKFEMGDDRAGEELRRSFVYHPYYDYTKAQNEGIEAKEKDGYSTVGGGYISHVFGRNFESGFNYALNDYYSNPSTQQQMRLELQYNGIDPSKQVLNLDDIAIPESIGKDGKKIPAATYRDLGLRGETAYDLMAYQNSMAMGKAHMAQDNEIKSDPNYIGMLKLNYLRQKDEESKQQGTPLLVPSPIQNLTGDNNDLSQTKKILRKSAGILTPRDLTSDPINYWGDISDAERGIATEATDKKQYSTYVQGLKTQIEKALGGKYLSPSVIKGLKSFGIDFKDGKVSGKEEDIENYFASALQNSGTTALQGFTLTNLDPKKLANLYLPLAASGRVQITVNGNKPSDAAKTIKYIKNNLELEKGVVSSLNPTSIYGYPSIDITVPKEDGKGVDTYSIGLDETSNQYFQGIADLTNSMLKGETDKEIVFYYQPTSKGLADVVGINRFMVNEDGSPYIGTETYLRNPKTQELVRKGNYNSWLQDTIAPDFLNSSGMYPYRNSDKQNTQMSGGMSSFDFLMNQDNEE